MIVTTGVWVGGLGLFGLRMFSFSYTPGKISSAPATLPDDLRHDSNDQRLTLLMFAHPRCPCTRATLAELARTLASAPGNPDLRIFFFIPVDQSDDWVHGWNWNTAAEIHGASVSIDVDGVIARRCYATTSGQILLYDASGRLLFSGGITSGRGHEGDNPGADIVLALLRGEPTATVQSTSVFGCPLTADQPAQVVCRKRDNP